MALLVRNLFIFSLVLVSVGFFSFFLSIERQLEVRSYSEFIADLQASEVKSGEITGHKGTIELGDGLRYTIVLPDPLLAGEKMMAAGAKVTYRPDYSDYYFQGGLVLIAGIVIFISWLSLHSARKKEKSTQFASGKLFSPDNKRDRVTFNDVAGVPEAKEELEEVVSFLKNPEQFNRLGAFIPKGMLLQGPPGTGKTLLARAIAGEAGVPFYSFSGSDFVEMFVGVGASRVRDLFREAKKNTPCIIFIDEIDAVGIRRAKAPSDGQDERGQTLNALLVEMDGFGTNDNIIVLAATNRPDTLDPALSRPGRFDRRITLLPPDVKGRVKILQVHTKKVILSSEVNLEEVAKMTSGFTGAELASLVNEAALLAGRDNREEISQEHFDLARDRIMLGVERKGFILTKKDKMILAYHEAGHAIVAKMLPKSDPVHKITIIPRGRALGQTQQLPLGDRTAYSKEYLINKIKTLLGGRAAEEIIFNSRTTRTENDLQQATEIATQMICRWGMSETLGPQTYTVGEETFLGEELSRRSTMSDDTANLIDREIKAILSSCYKEAVEILRREKLFLNKLSEILFEVETLDAEEFDIIYLCSLAKKAEAEEEGEPESECSACPAKGHCLQHHAN